MKHMRLALAVVSTLCLTSLTAARYPAIMWSETAFNKTRESHEPIHAAQFVDTLKATFEGSQASNLFVFVKEGMTSKELVANVRDL